MITLYGFGLVLGLPEISPFGFLGAPKGKLH
jgi:hypothetical protein